MRAAASSRYKFCPELPDIVFTKLLDRSQLFYVTYRDLAAAYSPGFAFYQFPNIDLPTINYYSDGFQRDDLHLDGPWISGVTYGGYPWAMSAGTWGINDPPPDPGEFDLDYWGAMCTGYQVWLMYATGIVQQAIRLRGLGHYGRPHDP